MKLIDEFKEALKIEFKLSIIGYMFVTFFIVSLTSISDILMPYQYDIHPKLTIVSSLFVMAILSLLGFTIDFYNTNVKGDSK